MKNVLNRHYYSPYLLMITFWMLFFNISIYAGPQNNSINSDNTDLAEKVYKLPPPGEDPRLSYLYTGERMFYSREFKKAREAFEKVLHIDSSDPQAQYFLGLIEYEEGNIDKAKLRFQIAHECLKSSVDTMQLPIDNKHVQLEFPEGYEARLYYEDGWNINPKTPSKNSYLLKADSTYRIILKSPRNNAWISRGIIGFSILFTFFAAR